MRVEFAEAVVQLATLHKDIIFLTGDLGYMALEQVRSTLGTRFVNAGVAEQNMVSMAAGLAARGFRPIVYSIAPFATFRPFEQIRNDVCLHNLPVVIVGNGGGYGYGIMGSTHHALEDVGALRTLPHMRVYTPSFGSDVAKCLDSALTRRGPCYVRLGKSVKDYGEVEAATPWQGFRRVCKGSRIVIAAMGPLLENIIAVLPKLPPDTVDLWTVGEFPLAEIPQEFKDSIMRIGRLVTVEEHYRSGGLAECLAPFLLGTATFHFKSLHATGYPSGLYGSQRWHQAENGLDESGIQKAILGVMAA